MFTYLQSLPNLPQNVISKRLLQTLRRLGIPIKKVHGMDSQPSSFHDVLWFFKSQTSSVLRFFQRNVLYHNKIKPDSSTNVFFSSSWQLPCFIGRPQLPQQLPALPRGHLRGRLAHGGDQKGAAHRNPESAHRIHQN